MFKLANGERRDNMGGDVRCNRVKGRGSAQMGTGAHPGDPKKLWNITSLNMSERGD